MSRRSSRKNRSFLYPTYGISTLKKSKKNGSEYAMPHCAVAMDSETRAESCYRRNSLIEILFLRMLEHVKTHCHTTLSLMPKRRIIAMWGVRGDSAQSLNSNKRHCVSLRTMRWEILRKTACQD